MWILPGKQKSKGGEEREYNVEEASTLWEVKKKKKGNSSTMSARESFGMNEKVRIQDSSLVGRGLRMENVGG